MITTLIGVIGVLIILLNLFLLETGRVKGKSKTYLFISFFGSLLLAWYAWLIGAYIFVALDSIFVFLSLFWLLRLHR